MLSVGHLSTALDLRPPPALGLLPERVSTPALLPHPPPSSGRAVPVARSPSEAKARSGVLNAKPPGGPESLTTKRSHARARTSPNRPPDRARHGGARRLREGPPLSASV